LHHITILYLEEECEFGMRKEETEEARKPILRLTSKLKN
jgi:hypothetical protein